MVLYRFSIPTSDRLKALSELTDYKPFRQISITSLGDGSFHVGKGDMTFVSADANPDGTFIPSGVNGLVVEPIASKDMWDQLYIINVSGSQNANGIILAL